MPRVDFNKAAILSPEEQGSFKSAQEIISEVEAQAEEMGLKRYPRPTGEAENLTEIDITTMTNNALGQLFMQYTAFAQYIYGEHVRVVAAYKVGVSSLKLVEANLKSKFYAKDVAKAEVPALVREDPIRIECELEVLKLFAMREILEAHYKAYQRSADALSRIIELRKLDFDQSMREAGIQNHRKGGPRPARDFSRG